MQLLIPCSFGVRTVFAFSPLGLAHSRWAMHYDEGVTFFAFLLLRFSRKVYECAVALAGRESAHIDYIKMAFVLFVDDDLLAVVSEMHLICRINSITCVTTVRFW